MQLQDNPEKKEKIVILKTIKQKRRNGVTYLEIAKREKEYN